MASLLLNSQSSAPHILTTRVLTDVRQAVPTLPPPASHLPSAPLFHSQRLGWLRKVPDRGAKHISRQTRKTQKAGQRRSCPLGEVKQGQCPVRAWQRGAHRPALLTCLTHGGLAKWPSQRGVLKWQGGREGRTGRRADSVLPLLCPQGDSGGPLVCDNVAQGIVSYGKRDGSTPRAFTKVSSFLPWIKKTMKSL